MHITLQAVCMQSSSNGHIWDTQNTDKVAWLTCQSAQQHGTHHCQAGRCTGTALYAAPSIPLTASTATVADTDQQQSW